MLTLIILYASATAAVVMVLLFGEWPVFKKTPISWCHWFLTTGFLEGSLSDYQLLWRRESVRNAGGHWRGICCEQKNPAVQILYGLIVLMSYYVYYHFLFVNLPNPGLSGFHVYTGTLMALLCSLMFVICSVSDPGTVTAHNVEAYRSLFPRDKQVFPEKLCGTCHITRPAYTRHCSLCKKCVARHDHHCIWINNCIGRNNHRYFLLFLISNFLATLYGSVALPLFIHGEIAHVLHRPLVERATGKVFYLAQHPMKTLELVAVRYTPLFALHCCTVGFCFLLFGFLAFHFYLVSAAKTTNDCFKWSSFSQEQKTYLRQLYHKGWRRNVWEVFFPLDVHHKQN